MIHKKGGKEGDKLSRVSTHVSNLDEILDGGFPELATTIITGPPGSGKTILAQQIGFGQALSGAKVLYLSTLAEPMLKIIRYQSQFSFFRQDALDKNFFYRTIADVFKQGGFEEGLAAILKLVEEIEPQFVFIDSFKALTDLVAENHVFRRFVYDLIVELTSKEITTFLVAEYPSSDISIRPEFAIVDGIILLYLAESEDQPRYLEVRKLRGSKFLRGRHPFEINGAGITCYPHPEPSPFERHAKLIKKVSTNIGRLDVMTSGGFYEGSVTIVAGSAGTGKTSLAMKFLGKDGLLISFEEKPGRIERYAQNMEFEVPDVLYISPVQFIGERATRLVKEHIDRTKPKRVTIDGMSDVAMDNDVIYDLIDFLMQRGITTMMIYEIRDAFGSFSLVPTGVSRLVDNIILLRYVELNGKIERFLTILKMRGSPHETEIRIFEIRPKVGLLIKERMVGLAGLMMGIAHPMPHMIGEELAKGFRF